MKLKPLALTGEDSENIPKVRDMLTMLQNYRAFVGNRAAFHVEYTSWPGEFDSKDEEMDYSLNDYSRPKNYETVGRWHDELNEEATALDIKLIYTRYAKNFWRAMAIVLAIPYLIFYYLWNK